MSVVEEIEHVKSSRTGSVKPVRAFFLLIVVIVALFASVGMAEAAGNATKLIIFTDKKVYLDWAWNQGGHNKDAPPEGAGSYTTEDLMFYIYAVVLDDDGNIMTGRTSSLSGTIDTQNQLDHYDKSDTTVHHAELASTLFDDTLTFVDDGSVTGDIAGDGVYTALSNPTDPPDTYTDDHFLLNITVTDSTVGTEYTYALVSGVRCKSAGTGHGTHSTSGTNADNCAVCHSGYEHFYENVSGTIPESKQDVHFGRMNPPNVVLDGKGYGDYIWNSSNTAVTKVTGTEWGSVIPGSRYCPACHITPDNSDIYDLGGGGRSDPTDVPSCNQGVKTGLYENSATVTCHATTEMKNTPIPTWIPSGATATAFQNYNITKAESHNHTSNSTGISCALCHLAPHSLTMPNMSADISSTGNINNQCVYCHNISGGLDITSNGGGNVAHTNPDCAACHKNETGVLDVHLVPTASVGGVNCSSCHDIGGSAGYDIDITNTDSSSHANLNNLSQYTAGNASNRKCWACHGNSSNSYANESNQPDGHNSTYKTPKTCPDCHDNTDPNSNFSAPQAVEHIQGAPTVPTTDIKCSICHNNSLTSITESDGFGLTTGGDSKNASVSHYLTTASLMTSSDCSWCHFTNNANVSWGTPIDPRINFSSLHTGKVNNDCYNCHGGLTASVKLHESGITAGGAGGQDCVNCHDGTVGNKVNVDNMNNSDSIHLNLNTGGDANGRSENKMCYACHTNDSYINASGVVNNNTIPTSDHPTGYTTPKNCTLCHINTNSTTNFSAPQVSEHYAVGTELQTRNYAINLNDSCIGCHIENEMLQPYSDATGTNYSNVSHYGKSRNNTALVASDVVNCKYCHDNGSSTTFDFVDTTNRTILNHSANYPLTTPDCTLCHNEGRMHDGNLTIPALDNALCTSCHTARDNHNSSVSCLSCHINSSLSRDKVHPIQYINASGIFNNSNTTAVNCTDCHQSGVTGFESAPIIPDPLRHSTNPANGSIWGSYWNDEEGSCHYCHGDTRHNITALGNITNFEGSNVVGGDLTGTWCLGCHLNGSANYNNMLGNLSPVPPEITAGDTNYPSSGSPQDHSGYTMDSDNDCTLCHAGDTTNITTYMHDLEVGQGGGRNCTSCHDIGKSSEKVDVSKMNTSTSIHTNLNSLATASNADNKRCWACHTNSSVSGDGQVDESELPDSSHPDGYNTPKNCTLCHIDDNFAALLVSEHFTGGTDIQTKPYGNTNDSCVNCHNKTEMLLSNSDPDGPISIYASVSHYGDNKTGVSPYNTGSTSNCTYCHNNTGTAFSTEMVDSGSNTSILNHTNLGTTPSCSNSTCHNSGRIHESPLTKPIINNTFCTTCHVNKEVHNGSTDLSCSSCHLETNLSIHGIQYLQPDNSWGINSPGNKSSAVNCTDCHQSGVAGFETAPIIPDPAKHSSNLSNGSIWGSYWNDEEGSCHYCHDDTRHNSTAFGKINSLLSDSNNTRSGDISVTTWCADCHYNDSENVNYLGTQWSPSPPVITVDTGLSGWENHSTYLGSGYKDTYCKDCHGSAISGYTENSLNFSHAVSEGGGGPDCVSSGCHGSTGSATSPYMNWTSLKSGMHANLNSGADTTGMTDPIVAVCWACHGDGTKPGGHPTTYKQPYYCDECHLASGNITGQYPAINVSEHQHLDAQVLTNSTTAKCENCHYNSLVDYSDNETNSLTDYVVGNVSHYGANNTVGKLMEFSVNSTNCVYCHLNDSNRAKWANATNASATKPSIHSSFNASTDSSECWSCHVDGGGASTVTAGFTLHNTSLNPGASEFCLNCHTQGGSAQNVNVSSNDLGQHVDLNTSAGAGILNNSDCWSCHFGYPNGTSGTHSYDVSSQNTYYCEDCHGPSKNATTQANGVDSSSNVLADFYHGKTIADYLASSPPKFKDCSICHLANNSRTDINGNRLKIYHNQTPYGKVANTGWDGWTVGMIPGCNDCHQTRNLNDGPFYAPGKDHYVASSGGCRYNCHDMAAGIHQQLSFGDSSSSLYFGVSPPEIRSISINSPVVQGADVNITILGVDNYLQIAASQYRVVNSTGVEIAGWVTMTPQNNKFKSRAEISLGTIDSTGYAVDNYTLYVRVMASGPKADKTKRAYPLNGAWSGTYSTIFTVKP